MICTTSWVSYQTYIPFLLGGALGGNCATFTASPKAPGKELLSRTTNEPGALSRSMLIARMRQKTLLSLICFDIMECFARIDFYIINSDG